MRWPVKITKGFPKKYLKKEDLKPMKKVKVELDADAFEEFRALAEDGVVPLKFDQMEESTRKNYLYRTEWNVVHSDATLILAFGTELTGGTKRRVEYRLWLTLPRGPRHK